MIPITADVSNAIARYNSAFGYRITMGDISTGFNTPEEFVKTVNVAIENKDPRFGGEYIEQKKKRTRKKTK